MAAEHFLPLLPQTLQQSASCRQGGRRAALDRPSGTVAAGPSADRHPRSGRRKWHPSAHARQGIDLLAIVPLRVAVSGKYILSFQLPGLVRDARERSSRSSLVRCAYLR